MYMLYITIDQEIHCNASTASVRLGIMSTL